MPLLLYKSTINMKNSLLTLLCLGIFQSYSHAQMGLEGIIVETYYISNTNDASVNDQGGILPSESITYRVYVDMLPEYKLQAIYGIPGHEMRIQTTSLFFNNEDRGATTPTYTKNQAKGNTVMLDSWLSVGAACAGNFGILKSADDGVATNVNSDGVLQNNNPAAGIPLTEQDGLILGTPQNVTTLGLDAIIGVFDNQNDGTNGPVFSTEDGSWAALSGATGPTPETNQVLIGQFTTDGILSFSLNIQIGTPDGGVENYVASNPVGNEVLFPELNFTSDVVTKNHFIAASKALFSISPNPAQEILNIRLNKQSSTVSRISIYGMQGQLIHSSTSPGIMEQQQTSIGLAGLESGPYLIEVIQDGKRSIERFIKQ